MVDNRILHGACCWREFADSFLFGATYHTDSKVQVYVRLEHLFRSSEVNSLLDHDQYPDLHMYKQYRNLLLETRCQQSVNLNEGRKGWKYWEVTNGNPVYWKSLIRVHNYAVSKYRGRVWEPKTRRWRFSNLFTDDLVRKWRGRRWIAKGLEHFKLLCPISRTRFQTVWDTLKQWRLRQKRHCSRLNIRRSG